MSLLLLLVILPPCLPRFGVGSSSPGCSRRKSAAAFPADPLDNVLPVVGFAAMLPELMQPDGLVLPLSTNTLQQAALNGQQQQHSAGQPQAAALAAPSQPRPMWVPSAGGVAASRAAAVAAAAAGSPDRLIAQQQQPQQQQNREIHQQQQQDQDQGQEHKTPAPFVLGTWAQRQYILPVQRPGQAQSNEASTASPAPAGQHQQHEARQGGSSSPARPIPRGKFPSSNGSSNSSGSTRGKAAQRGAVQHSSSGSSSEPPPAAGTQQVADDAAAAADAAEVADGGLGAAANGDDAAAAALWQVATDAGRAARRSLGTDEEEEAVQQIAWRWRFARRWQAEQARGPLDPAATASVGDGGMEEALQYLAACGENWQHLSRESSRLGTVESRLLGTLGSLGGLGSELLADESFSAVGSGYGMQATLLQDTADSGGPLAASCAADSREVSVAGDSSCDGAQQQPLLQPRAQEQQGQQGQAQPRRQRGAVQPRGEATVQVTGITKRAQELLVAQEDINRQAHARCASAMPLGISLASWLGLLPAVLLWCARKHAASSPQTPQQAARGLPGALARTLTLTLLSCYRVCVCSRRAAGGSRYRPNRAPLCGWVRCWRVCVWTPGASSSSCCCASRTATGARCCWCGAPTTRPSPRLWKSCARRCVFVPFTVGLHRFCQQATQSFTTTSAQIQWVCVGVRAAGEVECCASAAVLWRGAPVLCRTCARQATFSCIVPAQHSTDLIRAAQSDPRHFHMRRSHTHPALACLPVLVPS